MLTMALLVGVSSGFGAVAFQWLVRVAEVFFFHALPEWLWFLGGYALVVAPALGGLLVGLLIHLLSPESVGPGVAPVMEALTLRGGRIRPIVIAAKPLATALTIGSGGSGGRVGPIVQIGSAIGSGLSQLARLSDKRTKSLVAAGAAAGLAATFNAPLAGVMFAVEILLAKFELIQFTSLVVAPVIASLIGHAYLGDAPTFPLTASAPPNAWELPIYGLLGLCAAFIGVAFTRALYLVHDVFENLTFPPYLKPAVGGLVVGVVGLWVPQILGIGYDSIEAVVFNRLTLASIVVFGLLKLVVTSMTIGSGGSAGIFGPSLFLGAMLGGVFGQLVQRVNPAVPVAPSYALVGMAAAFGAASHAPITAILMLFEMTRDYNSILPLMLSTVISAVVARHLFPESIFTVEFSRQEIDVHAGKDLDLMSTIVVREAMTPMEDTSTVAPNTPLAELARIFDETHHHGLVVIDQHGQLRGVVTLGDLERAQAQQQISGQVKDIHSTNVHTVFPDETLEQALRHFGVLDVGRVPVVDRGHPNQVLGVLRRGDIVRAYSHAYMDEQARLDYVNRARLERRTGENTLELRLREHHPGVGKTLRELDLPPGCLVVSIRRGAHILIPKGGTRFRAGDQVVVLAPDEEEEALRSLLTGANQRGGPDSPTDR